MHQQVSRARNARKVNVLFLSKNKHNSGKFLLSYEQNKLLEEHLLTEFLHNSNKRLGQLSPLIELCAISMVGNSYKINAETSFGKVHLRASWYSRLFVSDKGFLFVMLSEEQGYAVDICTTPKESKKSNFVCTRDVIIEEMISQTRRVAKQAAGVGSDEDSDGSVRSADSDSNDSGEGSGSDSGSNQSGSDQSGSDSGSNQSGSDQSGSDSGSDQSGSDQSGSDQSEASESDGSGISSEDSSESNTDIIKIDKRRLYLGNRLKTIRQLFKISDAESYADKQLLGIVSDEQGFERCMKAISMYYVPEELRAREINEINNNFEHIQKSRKVYVLIEAIRKLEEIIGFNRLEL